MKKNRIYLAILFILSSYSAYSQTSIDDKMKEFVGEPISKVFRNWGPHQQVTEDGNGGKIFTWIDTREVSPMYLSGMPLPTTIKCTRSFFVDQNGTIYSYFYKGKCNWVNF